MVLHSCEGVVCRYRTGDVREAKMGGIIFTIDQMSLIELPSGTLKVSMSHIIVRDEVHTVRSLFRMG